MAMSCETISLQHLHFVTACYSVDRQQPGRMPPLPPLWRGGDRRDSGKEYLLDKHMENHGIVLPVAQSLDPGEIITALGSTDSCRHLSTRLGSLVLFMVKMALVSIKCAYILSVVALCEITRFQNNIKKYTFLPGMPQQEPVQSDMKRAE
ncbi:unnamed protein product [Miscanthus lutarioriparius]|uniref:Uncharacterized protein n=1 Tax=Miscanthus lutarioriparius TaxID=422564 RepID=A0A811QV66_9POAL|nr:unnamed protein product [Miscanthus lutarioriparius]